MAMVVLPAPGAPAINCKHLVASHPCQSHSIGWGGSSSADASSTFAGCSVFRLRRFMTTFPMRMGDRFATTLLRIANCTPLSDPSVDLLAVPCPSRGSELDGPRKVPALHGVVDAGAAKAGPTDDFRHPEKGRCRGSVEVMNHERLQTCAEGAVHGWNRRQAALETRAAKSKRIFFVAGTPLTPAWTARSNPHGVAFCAVG